MKCPKCGWNNDDHAVFCENCGEFLEDKKGKEKNQKAVFWGLTIAGVLCVILVIGVIAVVALKRVGSDSNSDVSLGESPTPTVTSTPTRELFTPTPTSTPTPTTTPTPTPVTPTPTPVTPTVVVTPTPAPTVIPTQPTHSYAIVEGDYTWEQAYATASSMGGHLVTITSAQEQTVVENLCNQYSDLHIVWMGSNDLAGSYQWLTNESFSYSKWASGEPNNEFNEEHYLAMYYLDSEGWVWNDEPNDPIKYYSGRMGFVVEYE